jgi:hypothetical protein
VGTASPRHHLLIRRHRSSGELAFHFCYVPPGQAVSKGRLVRAAGLRWPAEEDFEFGKDCFGLDQSQVRLYTAIARHTVLVMAALAVCAVTAALLHDRTSTQAPPPARPDERPPADPGMIPLTVPEITRLLTTWPTRPGHTEHWSNWRRRHQARARWYHQRTRPLGWKGRGGGVSPIVMTNRDRVDRGMGYLAAGLGPFVNKTMAAAFPDGRDWVQVLAARNPARYGSRHRYSPSDPRFLLRVVTEEWRVFKDQLSRVEQGYATELKDAGNRWAHGDEFSDEDTYRMLDTMERLLIAIGAADQASQARSLRLDLQQPTTRAPAPPAGTHAARPRPQTPERTGRTSGFWSCVTHAEVVRAIEEYDRLGQEQFLAEHGFGRATAYLLIYRGRSYDSKAILGVAYKYATGVRIGAHEFNGGVYGAAGVLRKLGFEVRNTRDTVGQRMENRASPGTVVKPDVRAPAPVRSAPQPAAGSLDGIVPERSLLVLTCSGRKEGGGRPPGPAGPPAWPQDLREARTRVLATAHADTAHPVARLAPLHRHLLPARPARTS